MSYDLNALESTLRCSFCSQKFNDEIKLIPDCGNSICGNCFENVKSAIHDSSSFECIACGKKHNLQSEMPDNVALLRLLNSSNKDKSLNEHAELLMPLIGSLQNKVSKLQESLDDREEINKCCDQLNAEIEEAFERALQHLSKLKLDLLNEISSYRDKSIDQATGVDDPTSKVKQQLNELSDEIMDYCQQWGNYFKRKDKVASNVEFEEAKREAKEYEFRMAQIEKRINSTNNNKRLQFKGNNLFDLSHQHLGELVDRSKSKQVSKEIRIGETEAGFLNFHSAAVCQVLFLLKGIIISGSKDATVKIHKYEGGKVVVDELLGHTKAVNSIAVLTNGWLASGSDDATIKIWNLNDTSIIKTLKGHSDVVFSLKALPDNCLASCSWDDTIKIWNPTFSDEKYLLMTIQGHGIKGYVFGLDTLSNGYLMTCSDSDCVLRIWNPKNGKLIKSVSTDLFGACSFLVLSNDNAAIGLDNGSIGIIDLANQAKSKTMEKCHREGVCSLLQLSNEQLLSGGFWQDPTIKLWNIEEGRLLQTVVTGQNEDLRSLSLSPSGRYFACGSFDKTIKVWPLNS